MQQPNSPQNMPAGQAPGNDPEFEALVSQIARLIQEGKLPEGFDLEEAANDPELMKLMREFGAEAGIRIYAAERQAQDADSSAMERVSARVRERGALPKSTRGSSAAPSATNYRGMSSDAFRTLMQQMKKTARDGGKTRL
jgi:hypothetical protein